MTQQSKEDKLLRAMESWGEEFAEMAKERTSKPMGDLFGALMEVGMELTLKLCTEALRDREGFNAWTKDQGVSYSEALAECGAGEMDARYLEHRIGALIKDVS